MTNTLIDAYDQHTAEARDLTRQAIAKLVKDHGANEGWISVGSLFYAASGMHLGHIMDGKPLLTVDEFVQQQLDTVVDVALGLKEPWGKWKERNREGREGVKYSEWRQP